MAIINWVVCSMASTAIMLSAVGPEAAAACVMGFVVYGLIQLSLWAAGSDYVTRLGR